MSAKCPACGRFMATEPAREVEFDDGATVVVPPVAYCTRQACVDADEAAYEAFRERTGG